MKKLISAFLLFAFVLTASASVSVESTKKETVKTEFVTSIEKDITAGSYMFSTVESIDYTLFEHEVLVSSFSKSVDVICDSNYLNVISVVPNSELNRVEKIGLIDKQKRKPLYCAEPLSQKSTYNRNWQKSKSLHKLQV